MPELVDQYPPPYSVEIYDPYMDIEDRRVSDHEMLTDAIREAQALSEMGDMKGDVIGVTKWDSHSDASRRNPKLAALVVNGVVFLPREAAE